MQRGKPDERFEPVREERPERATRWRIDANVVIPMNAAVAANVLSENAATVADAPQSEHTE